MKGAVITSVMRGIVYDSISGQVNNIVVIIINGSPSRPETTTHSKHQTAPWKKGGWTE